MREINGLSVLEKEDFEKTCPSFYATHPKIGQVSEKYTFLNTRDIADQLWDSGWMPVYASEAYSRDQSNRGFTRHVVRFANKDFSLGEERIELVGMNSHNKASAFKFFAGVFRLVCSNGMVTQSTDLGSFKIKHIGDIEDQVRQAIQGIASQAGQIANRVDEFKAIDLTPNEQNIYASSAHEFIYPDQEKAPINPNQLLLARRYEDNKSDLWTTYNRVQENTLKGGLRGRATTGRRMKTRAVKSIEKDVKLNQALWSLTEKMAELKAA
jgi:hypothetical protein